MTVDQTPDPATAAENQLRQIEERARNNAKWVLATLGAVAAVVLAGVQLKDLSSLTGAQRHLALWGAGLAMGGTFVAIGAVAWIQRPDKVSVYQLTRYGGPFGYTRYLRHDPVVLKRKFDNLDDFKAAYEAALGDEPSDETKQRLHDLATLGRSIALDGHYYRFNRRFLTAMVVTFLGVVATTAGVLLFVANSSTAQVSTGPGGPLPVSVQLTARGRALLAPVIGRTCVSRTVRAISLANDPNGPDVVVEPTPRCSVARFTLTPDLGAGLQVPRPRPSTRRRTAAIIVGCARGDLNPHALAGTGT